MTFRVSRPAARNLIVAFCLAAIPAGASAQSASCPIATDPDYGFVKEKAIHIGGGAMYVAARERRYLDALRGPDGEVLHTLSRGTDALDPKAASPTILDAYQLTYEGLARPITLYLDAYHFSSPRAPRGFTCGAPLAAALGPPPIDPFKATTSIAGLAVERGSAGQTFAPMLLDADGEPTHGVAFDQFRMIALAAQAAAAAGTPVDANKPPPNIAGQGLTLVAYPLACGDKTIAPEHIEVVPAQGPMPPRVGDFARGDSIQLWLPGITVPPSSLAARFGLAFLRPADRIRIVYPDACNQGAREVLLPLTFAPPRLLVSAPAVLPPGNTEADLVVYVQAIIDTDGAFSRVVVLGGPESLIIPALDALSRWRASPLLVNGAPVVTPMIVAVTVR